MRDDEDHLFDDNVAYANVENSLEEILPGSEIVKDLFQKGQIGIVGGVYNIENGQVDFFKNLTKKRKDKSNVAAPKTNADHRIKS